MSTSRLSLAAFLMCLASTAAGQASEAGIPSLGATCVSCHSADGNPLVDGVPVLAGQRADYLASALRAYRDGRRIGGSAEVMRILASDLSDSDIKDLAEWFANN